MRDLKSQVQLKVSNTVIDEKEVCCNLLNVTALTLCIFLYYTFISYFPVLRESSVIRSNLSSSCRIIDLLILIPNS